MRYLTDFPDLPIMAFRKRPDGRLATLEGGKGGSAPPPPDYRGAAEQTAAGNLETAKFATKANRINQFTPYGSLRYRYTPQYDAEGKETGAGWEQTLDLTPEAQSALDEQLALNKKYGQVANIGFERARSIFENPELDVGALPKRAIDVGQTAQEALLARLNPQLQSQEEATRQRLANTGIGLGSDAFSREMAIQGQQANDLRLQAALQGINLDQANRAAALQEQAYLQDRPLNLINALRAGNQVTAPQFQRFAQQETTSGPDMMRAAQLGYGAQMDAYNADQAAGSGMFGGLFDVGMGLAKLPGAGGSMFKGFKGLFS
jgi:hypothetical protein